MAAPSAHARRLPSATRRHLAWRLDLRSRVAHRELESVSLASPRDEMEYRVVAALAHPHCVETPALDLDVVAEMEIRDALAGALRHRDRNLMGDRPLVITIDGDGAVTP